LPRIGG